MNWAQFKKPQRYIGNEWNVVKKTHSGKIKICICFPDLYEVGMSNLGIRIIYGLLNEFSNVVCERAFMPGLDLEEYLRKSHKKLFSLETKTPLDEFDVVGFNFGCELNYTNFLAMLELSGIPLNAKERRKIIVMGGGILNPEPIVPFIDVFYLGEFEEKASRLIEVMIHCKDKEERFKAFAEVEGLYVPRFYEVYEKKGSYLCEKTYSPAAFPLKKVYVHDLNTSYYPLQWLVPYTEIVHDRGQVEISRGCPNFCFFCQARSMYAPYREKKIERACECVEKMHNATGYENFSFLALSASNYSQIELLIERAVDMFKNKGVGISLPSLRADDIVGRLYQKLCALKKTALTVAIEAGTPDLRKKINKNIDVKALLEAKDILKSLSLRHIKLYFMFGLPQESEEDVVTIGELARRFSKELEMKVHISINVFIPKPFSLFEGVSMAKEDELFAKRLLIVQGARSRGIHLTIANIKKSILEGVMSRGDRRLSSVIERAYCRGARFDSYDEFFNWEIWENAFKEEGIEWQDYIYTPRDHQCWSHITEDGKIQNKCGIL